ncbi:sensor domain-containing diguanylate cyclase [Aerolutibacter ruishenii]|uniref:diguanylate cyclase n=1 Tax=Aerolutibacter ruishenii TaxID=686800 RepID=A0A562M0J9_9GAMM|nr:diguanylate cyclase [Lysobacter ruishenii]TWI13474.1 diguanylate cyclase (GGDEF)-like protein [Lysobacter ruishenii]
MRWTGWAVLLLCAWLWAAPAGAQALRVELLQSGGGAASPPLSASVLDVGRMDAAGRELVLHPPYLQGSYWLRLTTDRGIAPSEGRVLVLEGAHAIGPVVYFPPAGAVRVVHESGRGGSGLLRRGWVLALPNGWPTGAVAYLRVGGASTEAVRLRFSDVSTLALEQRAQARFFTASFTALMLMALAMLVIGLNFSERLYLGYGAYLVCLALYLMLQSGDAAEMWGLAWLDRTGVLGQWGLATLAVITQLGFTRLFLELPKRLPNGARAVRALQWMHVALLATLLVGGRHVQDWYYLVGNTLLVASVPVVVVLAVWAWRKGATYAGYYLLGWGPLLAMVMTMTGHLLGLFNAPWAEQLLPATAVLESGVLVLAVSRHAANRHRLAVLAREAVERDPLTGAMNAHAFHELLASWQHPGALGSRHYGLLLIDHDDLRQVNARYGRAVGDAVLQQVMGRIRGVLRPDDVVARLEADSFVVVTECSRSDCEQLAYRLSEVVGKRPLRIDGQAIRVTVSIGVAMSRPGDSVAVLLARAERALQGARIAGHGAVGHEPARPAAEPAME